MPQSGSGRVAAGRQEPDDQKVANVAGRAFGQILPSKNSLPLSTLSKLQRHWCCGIAQPECQPVPVGMIPQSSGVHRSGKENANRIASEQMRFRIGVQVGDIMFSKRTFSGGVKIALR